MPFSRGSFQSRDQTHVCCLAGGFFTTEPSGKSAYIHAAAAAAAKSLQSCPTLCDPIDCSPPCSSVRSIPMSEYWRGLPCLSPGDLSNSGTEPGFLCCRLLIYHLSRQGSPKGSVLVICYRWHTNFRFSSLKLQAYINAEFLLIRNQTGWL